MLKIESHCHTCYSKDCLVKIQDLQKTARKKGLDRVVVTDHNNFQGALEAHAIDPSLFIMGEEVMTREGELIGIYMQEYIPPGLSALQTIEVLHQQGAFITVAHPFDAFREGGWQLSDLLSITPHIDAIEIFNARCLLPQFNSRAKEFASKNNLPGTVGSDSHSALELGTATLVLPDFIDSISFKEALADAQPKTRLSPQWVHLYSRYAVWQKNRRSRLKIAKQ